jgi:lysophospholipase L1-like esterase
MRWVHAWHLFLCLALSCGAQSRAAAERFEKEIVAFEDADRLSQPRQIDVLLYGSSSFRLWTNVADAFPGVAILNRGFGGSELSDLNHFLDRVVVPHPPRVLLIYGGDNDLANGKSPEQVLADFKALVERVRQELPRTRVGFVAVKPSPKRQHLLGAQHDANDRVRRFARHHRRVDSIDTATPLLTETGVPDPHYFDSDRLHLNAAGYRVWRRVLEPYLRRWTR